MLKKEGILLLLYFFICAFEVISFMLLSRLAISALEPMTLLPIYILPLLAIRWTQLKTGQLSNVFMIVPILQMLLLFMVGYSLLTVVLIGLFICWRMYTHIKDPHIDSQGTWLALVVAATFAILLVKKDFLLEYVSWFMVLLVLFLAIRVMLQLRSNTWSFMKKGYQTLLFYIGGMAIVLLILYQGGLFLLKTILPYIGQGIAFILSYPLAWVIRKLKPKDMEYEDVAGNLEELQEDPFKKMNQNFSGDNDQLFLYIIVSAIIIVILLILYFVRKNFKDPIGDTEKGILIAEEPNVGFSFFNPLKGLKTFYSLTGKNEVRIQFQKLQVYLEKRGHGRLSSESAEEWFTRLGLLESYSTTLLQVYSRSRYSTATFTDQELDSYFKEIKEIKHKFPKKKQRGGKSE